jgi:hypothetical protein
VGVPRTEPSLPPNWPKTTTITKTTAAQIAAWEYFLFT